MHLPCCCVYYSNNTQLGLSHAFLTDAIVARSSTWKLSTSNITMNVNRYGRHISFSLGRV